MFPGMEHWKKSMTQCTFNLYRYKVNHRMDMEREQRQLLSTANTEIHSSPTASKKPGVITHYANT